MAENTLQFQWIVTIKEGLEVVFRHDPNVFVAGDLLWYPVEGDNKTRAAPDAMVAFGRPKGYRGSYKQWEECGIAPPVVFAPLIEKLDRRRFQPWFYYYPSGARLARVGEHLDQTLAKLQEQIKESAASMSDADKARIEGIRRNAAAQVQAWLATTRYATASPAGVPNDQLP